MQVLPHLEGLESQAALAVKEVEDSTLILVDPLTFVDTGCNEFLAELSLATTSYTSTFTNPGTGQLEVEAGQRLEDWGGELLTRYTAAMEKRLGAEAGGEVDEVRILVRALDRFHRRLSASARSLPGGKDLHLEGLRVVVAVSGSCCQAAAKALGDQLQEVTVEARQTIAQPRRGGDPALDLQEVNTGLLAAIADNVRNTLSCLQTFLDPELSFSSKPQFRSRFCDSVREDVLVSHLRLIVSNCQQFTSGRSVPPALLLLLSRALHDLHTSTTAHLASSLQEQFPGPPANLGLVEAEIAAGSKALLEAYVQVQAADLSLMLRKSVEARDWLSTVEPRSVRAVMKRVVEDVTLVDAQVGHPA